MGAGDELPDDLAALKQRLDEEESAYARLLAEMDSLAAFPLPGEALADEPALVERLNTLHAALLPAPPGRVTGPGAGFAGACSRQWRPRSSVRPSGTPPSSSS